MKIRLLPLFLLLYTPFFSLQAQLVLPMEGNPVLQAEIARQEQEKKRFLKENYGLQWPAEIQQVKNRGGAQEQVACVLSGDTLVICQDTTDLTSPGATFDCLNCEEAVFGLASLDSTCLIYQADEGIDLGLDTVQVEFCDGNGNCEVFEYHIAVHREGTYTVQPQTILPAETQLVIDLDFSQLPTPPQFPNFLECRDPLLSDSYVLDGKLFYTSRRFAGEDTICLLLFDQYCITDTVVYPFRIEQDTLELGEGFVDDFSNPSPYPLEEFWLDKNVFINRTLANNPPTLGVASFDGLDESGTPYGGDYGVSDYLTSAYIDLDPSAIGPTDVYLSFFFQPKGMAYSLMDDDSLVVELKDTEGEWQRVESFTQDTFYTFWQNPDTFEFRFYKLDSQFLYRGFQFRFKNYSDNRGTMEPWHLDMVRLEPRNVPPDERFDDMSFVTLPGGVLKRYTAMPWGHFQGNVASEINQDYTFTIRSNFNTAVSLDESRISIREAPFTSSPDLLPLITTFDATNFNPGEQKTGTRTLPPGDFDNLIQSLEALPDTGIHMLINRYSLNPGKDQDDVPGLQRNDTVDFENVFEYYFAYDDGTAEQRIAPGNTGERLAVRFTANKDDTLRAIQMHIPHYPSTYPARNFRLQVYVGELDDEPEYEQTFLETFYPDVFFDTLQGFTTFVLLDVTGTFRTPLFIPEGDFYIGWETNFAPVPVGFDRNNPEAGQYLFFKSSLDWVRLDTISANAFQGAAMLRPVLGDVEPVNTPNAVDEVAAELGVRAYPNPSSGTLFLESSTYLLSDFRGELYDAAGRLQQAWKILPDQLSLAAYPPGSYILQLRHRENGQRASLRLVRID